MRPKAKPKTTAGISPRSVPHSPWNHNYWNSLVKSFLIKTVKKPEAVEWSWKKLFKTSQQNDTWEISGQAIKINGVCLQAINASGCEGKTVSSAMIMLRAELMHLTSIKNSDKNNNLCCLCCTTTKWISHLTGSFLSFPWNINICVGMGTFLIIN